MADKFRKGDRVIMLRQSGRFKWTPIKGGQQPGDTGTVFTHYTGDCVPVRWDNDTVDPSWVEDLLDFEPKEKVMEDTREYLEYVTM